ncbi:O-linked N-acetylglucosamine transferase, SPINDLY family [Candidatus Magnetomorum sp. HK-1]|nr:O-linked N-acetylglucosamine transferase, SPINDLY family [Candidatus Magnetomorum sp. HK-1]
MDEKNSNYYNKLGNEYFSKNLRKKAINSYQQALRLNPGYYPAYNNIGLVLNDIGDYSNAMAYFEQAIDLNANDISHLYNMAHTLENVGNIKEALHYLERIIHLCPNFQKAYSSLLSALNYTFSYAQVIYDTHIKWGNQIESSIVPIENIKVDKEPNRILRVGYVSPDFYRHSVTYFFEPILTNHNKQEVYTVCYSDSSNTDNFTKRLMASANQWHDCRQMNDDDLANLIQKDQIDILVDLSGHTAKNRLLVFARKPAPIQVTYLGYVNTSGLSRMDYRIVDKWTDPIEKVHPHTETLVRLPNTFLCYSPPEDSPPVVKEPMIINNYVTFGSFNAIKKINDATVDLWAQIINAVPSSRLYLKCHAFIDQPTRENYYKKFNAYGISNNRLIFNAFTHSFSDHLAQYHLIDIGLDTYPYNGTTTTCEALWMGVPVITLDSDRHAGRVGLSILQSIGLKGLIAYTEKEYIDIAVSLANNVELISQLRQSLRPLLSSSALCNASEFTHSLESAYREMWYRYCRVSKT